MTAFAETFLLTIKVDLIQWPAWKTPQAERTLVEHIKR